MKTIKFILLVCIAFSFSQCKTIKLTETTPFTIAGTAYHNWVGGQPGVRGTNLIMGIENQGAAIFTSVYFMNRIATPTIESRKGKKYIVVHISTSKADGIEGEIVGSENMPKKEIAVKVHFPFQLKQNEAVIKYMIGAKAYYYKVSKIKKTTAVFYP